MSIYRPKPPDTTWHTLHHLVKSRLLICRARQNYGHWLFAKRKGQNTWFWFWRLFFFFLRDRHRGIIGGLTVQGHREEFENRCPRLYILDYHARAGNCLLCPNYCHLAGLGPIMFLWSHGIRFWALACGRYWGRKTPEKPTECWMVEVLFPIR